MFKHNDNNNESSPMNISEAPRPFALMNDESFGALVEKVK